MANIFIGKGNLADSPSLKTITSKKTGEEFEVASMRVMFGRYSRNQQGELEQSGGFWREVEVYGAPAKEVARLLRKGTRVLVVGEEVDFMAKDDDGNEVQVIKLKAEDIAIVPTARVLGIEFSAPMRRNQEEGETV